MPEDRQLPNALPDEPKNGTQPPGMLSPEGARTELLLLLRLLVREPPPDHDFQTCPICKRYGITEI